MLDLKLSPVDRRAVQATRGAGLEPRERESGAVETLRERDRGRIAETAGRCPLVAKVNHPTQEGAGGEHDCAAGNRAAVRELDARNGGGVGCDPSRLPL